MRRTALLLSMLVLAALVPGGASGQEEGVAQLTLVRQTPWTSIEEPKLEIEVRARNTGDVAVGQLAVGLTLWSPVRSRSAYELALTSDPSPPVPVFGDVRPQDGTLEPDSTRRFEVMLNLGSFGGVSTGESLIYPLKVDLRSGGTPLAALRTPVIFLVKEPQTPLDIAWTFVLHAPILFGAGGTFRSIELEQSLASGGRLAGAIEGLRSLVEGPDPSPVDLVVSPTLLMQLARMRTGYSVLEGADARGVPEGEAGSERAAAALSALEAIAESEWVELSAFPFAAPRLPSLATGGLARDLPIQLLRGRGAVGALLGVEPDPSVLRPPGSALDEASLVRLANLGVDLLILDATSVPPQPQPLGFAGPPTASLVAGGSRITAIVPDQGVQGLLASPILAADPVLGAQTVLGELAVIWLERPGVERGVAVTLSENLPLPSEVFGPLIQGISRAPWLRPVRATEFASAFPPADDPAALIPVGTQSFPHDFVTGLKRARRLIETYRSILAEPEPQAARLEQLATRLLLAESGEFLVDQAAGLSFITSVSDAMSAEFAAVRPDTEQPITLTSSAGTIPLRIANDTGQPVNVMVELVSPHLLFTKGSSRLRTLESGDSILNFDVELQTTGRFSVQVMIQSPSGRTINESTLFVRSTAFNRIALFITLGAALVLLALWARRFLPRAKT